MTRQKRYPYTKSQWEYSCCKFYANGKSKPYCVLWRKENRITGEKERAERENQF